MRTPPTQSAQRWEPNPDALNSLSGLGSHRNTFQDSNRGCKSLATRLGKTLTIRKVITVVIGVIIPHDGQLAIRQETFASLHDYQKAVGGYIEAVSIEQPAMVLFANEEGKIQGLPVNRPATFLWWLLVPQARHRDVLRGNVVLVGPADKAGQSTDVPEEMRQLLFDARSFKVEVQTTDNHDTWSGNRQVFGDYFAAAASGLSLSDRWTAVERVRVVAAD